MKKALKKVISLGLAVSMVLPMTAVFAQNSGAEEQTAPVLSAEQTEFEEQRRAEEETRRAEEEERRAQTEQERAKREKHMPSAMSHEEAKKRQAALDRQVGKITFNNSFSLFSAGDYSEVVYIETVEDLRSIDGHAGGYYELKNDIDLSGIEWEPLRLDNATFNGNGHTIKNMTITREPQGDIGFIVGEGIYVNELTLDNFKINVTITATDKNISALGNAYANCCNINGNINIQSNSCNAYAISSGSGSAYSGNITANADNSYVSVLDECHNCRFKGNVTSGGGLFGIGYNCSDCYIQGDLSAGRYLHGIENDCSGCYIQGDLSADHGLDGIENNCIDCYIQGDLSADDGLYGIENDCSGCYIEGNLSAGGYLNGISNCTGCYIAGDLSAGKHLSGIGYNCTDCYIQGDLSSSGYLNGIYNRTGCYITGCYIQGDLSSSGDLNGIYNCTGCYIQGDLSAGRYLYGIEGKCTGCYIQGDLYAGEGLYGIEDKCIGCYIEGDLYADDGLHAHGLHGICDYCTDCYIQGNLSAGVYLHGIYNNCTGCYIVGDLDGNQVTGIIESAGCYIVGNLYSLKWDAEGIRYSADCTINGNIIGSDDATGIYGGKGNYVSGVIQATSTKGTATASASKPYQAIYECDDCHTLYTSSYNPHYCYNHYDNTSYGPVLSPRSCSSVDVAKYADSSTGLTQPQPNIPTPPTPTPTSTPLPTTQPNQYSILIMESEAGLPIANAVINLDGKQYTTDKNGMAVINQSCRVGGLSVSLDNKIIYAATNWTAINGQVNTIKINRLKISADDLNLGKNASVTMEGPAVTAKGKTFNLFSLPFDFDFDVFKYTQIAYDSEKDVYQVILTPNGTGDNGNKMYNADDPEWIKKFRGLKYSYELASGGNLNFEIDNLTNPNDMHVPGKFGIDGDIDAYAFLELKPDGMNFHITSGGAVIKAEGSVGGGMPLPFAPAVYLAYSISGTLSTEARFTLVRATLADPQFDITTDITAQLTPQIGIGAGLQDVVSVECGIKGPLDMSLHLPAEKLEESLRVDFTGQFYMKLVLLCLKAEYCRNFLKLPIYPKPNNAADDIGDMKVIDRSYKKGRSSLYSLQDDVSLFGSDGTLKSEIYPYGDVKTAQLGNGKKLVVWLDDDTDRGLADKTALYYSVIENGTASEPRQVNNDATADFGFDISSIGNRAVIVWQNAKRSFSDDVSETMLAENIELSYAEFDGNAWSAPTAITSNGSYEYRPSVYYDGSTSYVAWVTNNLNSLMPGIDSVSENVYLTSVSNGYVGDVRTVHTGLKLVYDIAAGSNGAVAVIADKDGDFNTDSDAVMYCDGNECYGNNTRLLDLSYENGSYYFNEDGNVKRLVGNAAEIVYNGDAQNARLIQSGNNKAVVYEVQSEFTSNLYASYYESSGWSAPVPVTDFDEKIRSWSADFNSNGELEVAAIVSRVDTDGETISEDARIVCAAVNPIEDIKVGGICAKDTVSAGKTVEFDVRVENNTKSALERVHVTLTGESAGELYSKDLSVYIPSGEYEFVTVRTTIPVDFVKQNITAEVTSDVSETNNTNNSASAVFGDADLKVKLSGASIEINGYAKLTVENIGCADAENTVVTLSCDGDEIYTENIGTLAAGEKKVVKITADASLGKMFSASVQTSSEEQYDYNNKDYYELGAETVLMSLSETSIALETGKSYTPQIKTYPEKDIAVYGASSDETVATVDENGKITAVANGTARITYMSPDTVMSATMTVYVRDNKTPEIVSAAVDEYGHINAVVDASECLAEGETENLIMAVYDASGALIGITTKGSVTASANIKVSYNCSDRTPKKVKIMLWNSLSKMKPAAYAAETQVSKEVSE